MYGVDVSSLEEIRSASEKLRTLVEASRLDLEDGSLSVSISIGATRLLPGDTPESLVRRADQLMYRSKREGRNRVSVGDTADSPGLSAA